MASQLTKRGYKYRSLPTNDTDTFGDFLNDDSEFNIKKLDADLEKLDDKVLLDGERKQNFNFIENKVVQDGLCTYIDSINDYSVLKEFPFTQEVKNFTLQMKMNFNKLTNGKVLGQLVGFKVNEFSFQLVTWEDYLYLVFYDKNDVKRVYKATVAVGLNKWINVVVSGDISKPTLTMNNKENPLVLSDSNAPNIKVFNKLLIGINNSADGLIKSVVLTNRILSGQEIQHNFSVLNNSSAIKELHTTDSTGKTSILPTLYKESKKARGTLIEIPYDEPRDLENYIYKFI